MKKFNYAFATILTVSALTGPVMAKDKKNRSVRSCHRQSQNVDVHRTEVIYRQGALNEVQGQLNVVESKINSIHSSINSAKNHVTYKIQAHKELVHTFDNAEEILAENSTKLAELIAALPKMEDQAAKLRKEYEDISGWRVFSRSSAKSKWEEQVKKVERQKSAIKNTEDRIVYVNNVVENFTTLEAAALDAIDEAESTSINIQEESAYELNQLEERRIELLPRVISLQNVHAEAVENLRVSERKLNNCLRKKKREEEELKRAQAEAKKRAEEGKKDDKKPSQGERRQAHN